MAIIIPVEERDRITGEMVSCGRQRYPGEGVRSADGPVLRFRRKCLAITYCCHRFRYHEYPGRKKIRALPLVKLQIIAGSICHGRKYLLTLCVSSAVAGAIQCPCLKNYINRAGQLALSIPGVKISRYCIVLIEDKITVQIYPCRAGCYILWI